MKWTMSAACGVAISLLTAPADACRAAPGNSAYHPIFAGQISAYTDIYLARAVSATASAEHPQSHSLLRPAFLYEFEVLETLRGQPVSRFQQFGSPPFISAPSPDCVTAGFDRDNRACQVELNNLAQRHRAHVEADAGRTDWGRFYTLRPLTQSGMGAAETYDPDVIVVGCGSAPASFELGETFLVMRDESGAPYDGFGLNYQLITRPDDAWLDAVRYFVANETAERLPARSVRETLNPFGMPTTVRFDECSFDPTYSGAIILGNPYSYDSPWVFLDDDTRISFYQRLDLAEEARSHCESGGHFIVYPSTIGLPYDGVLHAEIPLFPIRDGMVDFSHLATQWTLNEPASVPLEDVLTWPALDAEVRASTP